ncbi:MAG: enoyl-CoA hydratase/isomerase family protein [Silicimonas sp.]|nr:enoyl-CoA hydratase/isomerase family protein [Silicimonas sp.]
MSKVLVETRALESGSTAAILTFNAPRANALEPEFLAQITRALDSVAGADAVVLTSSGRNFSSGGDVGAFVRAFEDGTPVDYARQVVPPLQKLVYRLAASDQIVGLAGTGAITGGSAGFLFAADLVVLSPGAFIQPYYAEVGFAPDGGWAALLPLIIGPAHALRLQIANRRIEAREALVLGLAQDIIDPPLETLMGQLNRLDLGAARCAKRLIWTEARLAQLSEGLEAETQAFLARIALPETRDGMGRFLDTLAREKA